MTTRIPLPEGGGGLVAGRGCSFIAAGLPDAVEGLTLCCGANDGLGDC